MQEPESVNSRMNAKSAGRAEDRRTRALAAVTADRRVHGEMRCPNCGGNLRFAKSPNGHVSGKCSTAGCVMLYG